MAYLLAVCPACGYNYNYGEEIIEYEPKTTGIQYQNKCPRCGCTTTIIPAWMHFSGTQRAETHVLARGYL